MRSPGRECQPCRCPSDTTRASQRRLRLLKPALREPLCPGKRFPRSEREHEAERARLFLTALLAYWAELPSATPQSVFASRLKRHRVI